MTNPPTMLVLDNSTVREAGSGAVIGALTVTDPDHSDGFTYTLSDDRFEVVDGQLKLKDGIALDHETEPSLTLTITVTDPDNNALSEQFTIIVEDLGLSEPSDLELRNTTVNEAELGAVIGELIATDNNLDRATFTVSDDRFEVVNGQLKLKDDIALDHEQEAQVSLFITVTDQNNQAYTEAFTIDVTDIIGEPSDLKLDNTTVDENNAGAVISLLEVTDPDNSAGFTYAVSDDRFEVVSGQLRLKDGQALDFEQESEVAIDITVTDADGKSYQETFNITVIDVNERPTGDVIVNGVVAPGRILFANATMIDDPEGLSGPLAYQWQSSTDGILWVDVSGATSATLRLDNADMGKMFRVEVSYTDDGGVQERLVSAATEVVSGDQTVELADIGHGITGLVFEGQKGGDRLGWSVSDAGDVNGDGVDDIILGAWGGDPNGSSSGKSYVVFGNADGTMADLSDIENGGGGGFVINGANAKHSLGWSVSGAGDVNGDGLDDVIVGAAGVASKSYVVFGKREGDEGYGEAVEVSEIESDTNANGFVINPAKVTEGGGSAVSNAGDVNGDGLDDLIIGASGGTGRAYVVFGKADGSAVETSGIKSGTSDEGFIINGASGRDYAGWSVSGAGDVNGDGLDDLLVGAWGADPNGSSSGASYVVFGKDDNSAVNLSDIENGIGGGFVINGADRYDSAGYSVSNAGDVNGDGLDDLIVGAHQADPNGSASGASYVVFGKADTTAVDLSDIENGVGNGFVINGADAYDYSGMSVSAAGDVNGDGLGDLIIGAKAADPNGSSSGASYVVFGKTDTTAVELSDIENSIGGFVINGVNGGDYAGNSVSGAGDVNGDGYDDLLVGATYADPNGSKSGASYIVFGGAFSNSSDPATGTTLQDQSSDEDTPVSFTLPSDAFTDGDGDALTLTATLEDGSALPSWLGFEPSTGTFSGTPPQDYNGTLSIKVSASDGHSGSTPATQTFSLIINAVNDSPTGTTLQDQSSDEDTPVSFTLPSDAFTDVDGDALTLTATLADGTALPSWLGFEPSTGTFSGTPPQDYNGTLSIKVSASDGHSGSTPATQTFSLIINAVDDAAVITGDTSGAVTEDLFTTDSGNLDHTDVDNDDDDWNAETLAGLYGSLTIDAAGQWTYRLQSNNADVDGLLPGESLADEFSVTTEGGTQETITITINGANDRPTDIHPSALGDSLTQDDVDEADDVVATLTADDVDVNDSHTFTIVSQTTASAFKIVGNQLRVDDPSLLGTGIHSVTVRATDSWGQSVERTITIDLSNIGQTFEFTVDNPETLTGSDQNERFVGEAGSGNGIGLTAQRKDAADGGDGYDKFVLVRHDDGDAITNSIDVEEVSLTNIEVIELVNAAGGIPSLVDPADEIPWLTSPYINKPQLVEGPLHESLRFDASDSPNIDRVVFRDSTSPVFVRNLQTEFWTKTLNDDTDDGATVDIKDVTTSELFVQSAPDSKQFEDADGDGKDDGEIVFNLDNSLVNNLFLFETDGPEEQVGAITLRGSGGPSVIGSIYNGAVEVEGTTTHTLNIEVGDLSNSRPSSATPDEAGVQAAANTAAIDFFAGQLDGLGDGLSGLETVNISGGGDVFLTFGADSVSDKDGDGFTLDITDGVGSSTFQFEKGGFSDVKLDGGDGFDTLIVYADDLLVDPDALANVSNVERVVILESVQGGASLRGGDDSLIGDSNDDRQIGGWGNDFLDAGSGGTDVLIGDYGTYARQTQLKMYDYFSSRDYRVKLNHPDGPINGIRVDSEQLTYYRNYLEARDLLDDILDRLSEPQYQAYSDLFSFSATAIGNNAFLNIFEVGEDAPTVDYWVNYSLVTHYTYLNPYGWVREFEDDPGSDTFVAGARMNSVDQFRTNYYDNDLIPDDYQGLLAAAGRTPGADGSDGGLEGVVYVLDFNQGGRGDDPNTPENEAFDPAEGDLLAFRRSDGVLDVCGNDTNYTEVENTAIHRDAADAAAMAAFGADSGLRYYVNARTFDDAYLQPGSDVDSAQANSWLRVYYNEAGTDAAPEAVFELVGLDSIDQFSFLDIGGADCIDDRTDHFEYVLS